MGNEPITKDSPRHTDTMTEKVTTPPLDPVTNRRNRENVVTIITSIVFIASLAGAITYRVLNPELTGTSFYILTALNTISIISGAATLIGITPNLKASKELNLCQWEISPYMYPKTVYSILLGRDEITFKVKATQSTNGNPLAPWISTQDGNVVLDVQNDKYGEGTLIIHPADIYETTFDLLEGNEPQLVGYASEWRYDTRDIYWHLHLPASYHKHYSATFGEKAKGKEPFKGKVTLQDKTLSYKDDIRPYALGKPKDRLSHRLSPKVLGTWGPMLLVAGVFGGVALTLTVNAFAEQRYGSAILPLLLAGLCVFMAVTFVSFSAVKAWYNRVTYLKDYSQMWDTSSMGLPENFKEELQYRSRSIVLPLIPFGEDGSKYADWIQTRPTADADGKSKSVVGVYLPRGEYGLIELPEKAKIKYEDLEYPTGTPWVTLEVTPELKEPYSATIHLPASILD